MIQRLSIVLVSFLTTLLQAQWKPTDPGIRPLGISSLDGTFWICGAREGIASSNDGEHWTIHHIPEGTASLLGIEFVDKNFGYAFGTGGVLLITKDGGATWTRKSFGTETIVQASLADADHGLFRLSNRLVFTKDGGQTLLPVLPSQGADLFKRFNQTQTPVALSAEKMAVVLKEGPYGEGGYLATTDGGLNWKFYDPPSTGIGTLLRFEKAYWMVGMEVVGKDQPGGGHSVPLLATSSDGLSWAHGPNDINLCHMEGCQVCRPEGCLASTSSLVHVFASPVTTSRFAPKSSMSSKWASTKDKFCTLSPALECTTLIPAQGPAGFDGGLPRETLVGNLGGEPAKSGIRCLACDLEHYFVDQKQQGVFEIGAMIHIAADGTVVGVDLTKVPNARIENQMKDSITQWLFEPPIKDGHPVAVNLQTSLKIQVIRSK